MVTATDLALLVTRFLHLAPLVQTLGALVFAAFLLPRAGEAARAAILRLGRVGLGVALAGGLLWLLVQSMAMVADAEPGAALVLVLRESRFGETFVLRLLMLFAAAVALGFTRWRPGPWLAAGFTAAALLLQPWLGHGAAAEDAWLPPATAVHSLAASLWLGALLPLWIVLRTVPAAGAETARRFSRLGIACVLILAVTAAMQAPLIGDVPRFIGTPYGGFAWGKIVLFGGLLVLAVINRFVLLPRMSTDGGRGLRVGVLLEVAVGLLLLGVAAGLAGQPPGAHAQPVWLLPVRPVPTLWEDAFLRDRIVRTLIPLAVALGLAGTAAVWRRGRWPLAGAALAALFWVPDFPLKPYVRPAYPTSFQSWERSRSAVSLQQSAAVFQRDCAPCHAADARGRGPLATGTPAWPPDLTAPLYRRQRDGDLFWRISAGTALPDGTPTMPGFRDALAADDIWGLVDYLRARGSARSFGDDGRWSAPPRAPILGLRCRVPGGSEEREVDPAHPAGAMLYIDTAAGLPESPRPLAAAAPGTNLLFCRIADSGQRRQWLAALALLTERDARTLDGTAQIVDAQGWLRRLWTRPPAAEDVAAEAAAVLKTPLSLVGGHHN